MSEKLKKLFKKIAALFLGDLLQQQESVDTVKVLNAKILAQNNRNRVDEIIEDIQQAEFRAFSQFGDDGIISFLVDYLDIKEKVFIEFGVENYLESNTRLLLINNNWSGLVMDGSDKHVDFIKKDGIYWKYELAAVAAFITKENINSLISDAGLAGKVGLLHIDIDGNDYWVWKEINNINPPLVVVEYNSVFGSANPWTVPYDAAFYRKTYHPSNLCYGSSLLSLCDLAEDKGYHFIGCNSNGNNAYFVRKDVAKNLKPLTAQQGYVQSKFRESRGIDGVLTYINGDARMQAIKGAKVFNTRTNQVEVI